MCSQPCIDIIIVNYHSATDVGRCLDFLGPWPFGHIVLVDNSEDDDQAAALRGLVACRPELEVLVPPENLGFGRGCNIAFEQCRSDYVLLLNPDALIAATEVLKLAQTLDASPALGAVSPRIYWNDERSFLLPSAFPQSPLVELSMALASRSAVAARWAAGRYLRQAHRTMTSTQPFEVGFLAGAVVMLRRQAVLRAGGLFDPDFFMFFEDSDLSLRLRSAGYGLVIVPSASAVHEYRHKAFKADMMTASQQTYFRKRFPRFYAVSHGLKRVRALARAIEPNDWFRVINQQLRSAADFASHAGSAGVLAVSPSLLMMPAMFRPSLADAPNFSEAEWDLLEPASYVALIRCATAPRQTQWVYFRRTV